MRFNYERKPIDSSNAYARCTIVKWMLNYLEDDASTHLNGNAVDLILAHCDLAVTVKVISSFLRSLPSNHPHKDNQLVDEDGDFDDRAYSCFLNTLEEKWRDKRYAKYRDRIKKLGEKILDKYAKLVENDSLETQLDNLGKAFNLNEGEKTALLFFFLRGFDNDFSEISNTGGRLDTNKKRILEQFRIMTHIPKSEASKIFTAQGAIRKFELADSDWDINNPVNEYLNGMSDKALFVDVYSEYDGNPLPIEAHSLDDVDVETLKSIIINKEADAGVNILFHGVPGTGKTEFCRSLAADLGKKLFELHSDDKEENRRSFSRYTAFYMCQNNLPPNNAVIVIDEADEMLNAGGGLLALFGLSPRNTEKNRINELLDSTKTVNIWITNYSDTIEESTRRRFDYSIEFTKFGVGQRENAWNVALKKYSLTDLLNDGAIKSLAKEFEVNPGGIDVVLRNLKRLPADKRNVDSIKKLLTRHLELMNPATKQQKNLTPVREYSLKGLNIKGEHSIEDALEILTEFSDFMETPEYKESDVRNMNLLLYGPPGTGKTEFVKYLAQTTGRGLVVKRSGDFLDKYVGETEQKIRRVFKETEADGAILFIDEADGLFFDRSNSKRGFESSQVNELLVAMENFNGILVCATNFRDNMDFASIRRFNLKFEFDYLESDGNRVFYDAYLGKLPRAAQTKREAAELAAMRHLTPGDFKTVKNKYAFFRKGKLSHAMLLRALAEEIEHKQGKVISKIGFVNKLIA